MLINTSFASVPLRTLRRLAILLAVLAASASPLAAQCPEIERIVASDGEPGEGFGNAVAVDGDVAVVGAVYKDYWMGSAYVFRFNGKRWVEEQQLRASDGAPFEDFGFAVGVDGDVIVVGAYRAGTGSNTDGMAYVFRFDGVQWTEEQKLTASDTKPDDEFGYSVAVRGDVIAVGAPRNNVSGLGTDAGSVYVFRYDASLNHWHEEVNLSASTGGKFDRLGFAVAMPDDRQIVAGSPFADTAAGADAGSVSVFRFDGALWTDAQKLEASGGAAGDEFGSAVAGQGGVLVVGAPTDVERNVLLGGEPGSAAVFRDHGGQYIEEAKLLASDGAARDHFGYSVAVHGDLAVIGAYGDDLTQRRQRARIPGSKPTKGGFKPDDADDGSVHFYRFGPGCGWIEDIKRVASDHARGDRLGFAVAMNERHVLAGLYSDDRVGGRMREGNAKFATKDRPAGVGSVCVFDRAELALDILPHTVASGQTFNFLTMCGRPNRTVVLAATRINSTPTFDILLIREFDIDYGWSLAATAPPGLSGVTVTFQTFKASDPCRNRVLGSNEVSVLFQ